MHCKFKESQLVVRNPGTYILVVLYDEAFILLQFGWLMAATTCSCGARMKTTDSAPRTNGTPGNHPHVAGSMQGYSTAGNVVDGLMHSAIDQTNLHGLTRVGFQALFQLCHWPFSAAQRISDRIKPSASLPHRSRSRAQLSSRIRSAIRTIFTTTTPSRLMATKLGTRRP